jgi:hypothetical protein
VPLLLTFISGAMTGVAIMAYRGLPGTPSAATVLMGSIAATIATAALLVSWRTVRAGRHNAKATVTFQHIARTQADGDFIKARAKLRQLVKDGNIGQWAAAEHDADEAQAAINLVLNDLEITAIGIRRGIIDCPLFRRWCEGHVVKRWNETAPYITALRQRLNHPTLFHEFQSMAEAWDTRRPGYKEDPNSPFAKKDHRR